MEDSLIEPEEQVFIGTVYMQGQMLQETDGNSLIIYFVYYLPAGVRTVNNRVRFSASMEFMSQLEKIYNKQVNKYTSAREKCFEKNKAG